MRNATESISLLGYRAQVFAPFSPPAAQANIFCRGFALVGEKDVLAFMVSPATQRTGNKLNLRHCSRDEWRCYLNWPLAQLGETDGWFTLRNWQPVAYHADCEHADLWKIECAGEIWQLRWRTELDGFLELTQDNAFVLEKIFPRLHDPIFGWLHPATQFVFRFDGEVYQHCCWSGWPYRDRQLFCTRHNLPAVAARNLHWFDAQRSNDIWQVYLLAVAERLRIRAAAWDGWWQRFNSLSLPLTTDGSETEALHLLRDRGL